MFQCLCECASLADRAATQYDGLFASSCRPPMLPRDATQTAVMRQKVVCPSIRLSICV